MIFFGGRTESAAGQEERSRSPEKHTWNERRNAVESRYIVEWEKEGHQTGGESSFPHGFNATCKTMFVKRTHPANFTFPSSSTRLRIRETFLGCFQQISILGHRAFFHNWAGSVDWLMLSYSSRNCNFFSLSFTPKDISFCLLFGHRMWTCIALTRPPKGGVEWSSRLQCWIKIRRDKSNQK